MDGIRWGRRFLAVRKKGAKTGQGRGGNGAMQSIPIHHHAGRQNRASLPCRPPLVPPLRRAGGAYFRGAWAGGCLHVSSTERLSLLRGRWQNVRPCFHNGGGVGGRARRAAKLLYCIPYSQCRGSDIPKYVFSARAGGLSPGLAQGSQGENRAARPFPWWMFSPRRRWNDARVLVHFTEYR